MEFQHTEVTRTAPSTDHWMGTDQLGRDLLGRMAIGGAVSLSIGLASALIAVVIGTSVGLLAGYLGGRTDAFLMRLVDLLYGLPYILLVIIMRVALVPLFITGFPLGSGPHALQIQLSSDWANILVLLTGIGAVSWLTMARVIRGQVLSLREQPFIEAARAMGLANHQILLRHILPNLIGPIAVYATLIVPGAILSESFLSFLGLGIQPPMPSWGNLASDGIATLRLDAAVSNTCWWLILWPCAGLTIALLCLNFLGDGLRDALDPRAAR
jgi:oligopeptide transport system permease protein